MSDNWTPPPPIPVEDTCNRFIPTAGGQLVSQLIAQTPGFENADYLFPNQNVVLELKEVITEFGSNKYVLSRFKQLVEQLMIDQPDWKPSLLGGTGDYPYWFHEGFLAAFRRPLSRIIEKANRQLKSTKSYFKRDEARGVILFVNDGFISLPPEYVLRY